MALLHARSCSRASPAAREPHTQIPQHHSDPAASGRGKPCRCLVTPESLSAWGSTPSSSSRVQIQRDGGLGEGDSKVPWPLGVSALTPAHPCLIIPRQHQRPPVPPASPAPCALQPPGRVKPTLDAVPTLAAFPHPQATGPQGSLAAASLVQLRVLAGPWALEGRWSRRKAPACGGRDGAHRDSGSSASRGWAQQDAGPRSRRNGCHFHLLLPGREGEGGREEQRRELAVKCPDVMLLTEQIRSF